VNAVIFQRSLQFGEQKVIVGTLKAEVEGKGGLGVPPRPPHRVMD
jgi:hypothetical protein